MSGNREKGFADELLERLHEGGGDEKCYSFLQVKKDCYLKGVNINNPIACCSGIVLMVTGMEKSKLIATYIGSTTEIDGRAPRRHNDYRLDVEVPPSKIRKKEIVEINSKDICRPGDTVMAVFLGDDLKNLMCATRSGIRSKLKGLLSVILSGKKA
jgi:hypothetical protein